MVNIFNRGCRFVVIMFLFRRDHVSIKGAKQTDRRSKVPVFRRFIY